MDTLAFLRAVWPTTGLYCVAYPAVSGKGYAHSVFETIEKAAAFAKKKGEDSNVFFNVHALVEPQVWNDKKFRNKETKEWEPGWSVRLQRNMRAAKCFFFDLDVGQSTKTLAKYETRNDALVDLRRFCDTAKLPIPLVTSSGGGLHVYWLLQDEISSREWVDHAARLFALAKHLQVRVDASRTTDTSSVLRVVGTDNLKGGKRRPCTLLKAGRPTPTADFLAALDAALVREGVSAGARRAQQPDDDILGSNIGPDDFGPPVTIKQLGAACAQVRYYGKLKGAVDYTHWHKMLGLLRHVENGRVIAHALSSGPTYNRDACDMKLDEQEAREIGPTSCQVLDQVCGNNLCAACPVYGKVKGPIVAARWPERAAPPPPPPPHDNDDTPEPPKRLPPPKDFYLTKDGRIVHEKRTKDGLAVGTIILQGDLYPMVRQVDILGGTDQHLWCAKLPREDEKVFILPSGVLHDQRGLAVELSNRGIYVSPDNIKSVQTYMSAYIQDLQREASAESQRSHLGWTEDRDQFILPDKTLQADGGVVRTSLSHELEDIALKLRGIGKKGTLQRQVELVQFYNKPEYIGQQFLILGGLAAPIYFATGHFGCIINAEGETGASKSSALFTAGSFWGKPSKYVVNGTTSGASPKARQKVIQSLCNLPVCLDEITHIANDVAQEFAMNISQGGQREILDRNAKMRPPVEGEKATICLTTSNKSLHAILSHNNPAGTAGSMRVLEIHLEKADKRNSGAAEDFLFELNQNYGHIGEATMLHVIQNLPAVITRVRQIQRELTVASDAEPGERFQMSAAASILCICEIANKLGLIHFDVAAIRHWFLTVQMPTSRGVIVEEYPSATAVITSYIEKISGNTIVTDKGNANIPRTPNGAIMGRYERDTKLLWVLKDAFKDHCLQKRAPYTQYVQELFDARIILDKNARKTLGQGTEVEKGRSYCFLIDMGHADLVEIVDDIGKKAKGARPDLHVVK